VYLYITGIGRAIAKALFEAGAVTFALSKTQDHLNGLIEEVTGYYIILHCWEFTFTNRSNFHPHIEQ